MKHINIVYDDYFDDADILLVPDYVAEHIKSVVMQFNKWLVIPENHGPFLVSTENGAFCLSIDTEEFLWWLNNILITDDSKAVVVKQHTSFNPEYPIAEF